VLLSTHIASDLESIADRIALLDRGRLVAFESPEALLRFAAQAAAITCSRRGADMPRRRELP